MEQNSLLLNVAHPARYVGGEMGAVRKDTAQVSLTFALAFPEVYEIAMSHLGLKVLYEMLNRRPDVAGERIFAPWVDLSQALQTRKLKPWSLESQRPLADFDVVGFSLQYELTYTNFLTMLKLADIPLRREQRSPDHPLIIAGGPCLVNPEPVADFLDLALVGEAEEVLDPLLDLFIEAKVQSWPRSKLYEEAAKIRGIYIPSFFAAEYEQGRLKAVKPLNPHFPKVQRAVVRDMNQHQPPTRQVVPWVTPVHDRFALEIARGCTRGCRFCQAGYIYRPVRERNPEAVWQSALEGLADTGLDEMALLSLSTGDYSCLEPLAVALMDYLYPRRISLSLPSLRVGTLSPGLAEQIKKVRKTGFTLAPEAGSRRLRDVINKNITTDDLLSTAAQVYALGWDLIKLYFMIGLPGEDKDDLNAIGQLCSQVADTYRGRSKKPVVNASLGLFVPKAHTPFQWEGQLGLTDAKERLHYTKQAFQSRRVKIKWHNPESSVLEGVFARGDRRLSRVLESAEAKGCCFDGWSEMLKLDLWLQSLAEAGLSLDDYLRPRDVNEVLPWDHIDIGVNKDFLLAERAKAQAALTTADCRSDACLDCGVCDHTQIKPRLAPAEMPAVSPQALLPKGEGQKYHFRLEKTGPARFLGHLEMIKQLVRAFRRAGVSLAHSQGFHPHPLIKTSSALPLGVESLVEQLEVTLLDNLRAQEVMEKINPVLPEGMRLADGIRQLGTKGLQEPDEAFYFIRCSEILAPEALRRYQEADQVIVKRYSPKGDREFDLKPLIKSMELQHGGLMVKLALKGLRAKPAEILEAVFGLSHETALAARVLKLAGDLSFENNDAS